MSYDELTIDEIRRLSPDKIIISPGPGRPEDAGIIIDVVKELGKRYQSWVYVWGIRQSVLPMGA